VPRVRAELGYPPLVTPSSQIVGTQATLNVILGERYKVIPEEVKNYVKGMYGRPPAPIDPEVKQLVLGDEEPINCRPADLIPPGYEKAKEEIGDLARSEEDIISYALFPQVARPFLERRASGSGGKAALLRHGAEIAAAIAAMVAAKAAALARPPSLPPPMVISPWKVAWRPGRPGWGGLIK
jgi:oxaloacetate decarboxylase alpha subunit